MTTRPISIVVNKCPVCMDAIMYCDMNDFDENKIDLLCPKCKFKVIDIEKLRLK